MKNRTDLALEKQEEFFKEKDVEKKIRKTKGVEIIRIKIKTNAAAKKLKKPVGDYVTLQKKNILDPQYKKIVEGILTKEILKFVEKKNRILVVGLGNKEITPDKLGPEVSSKIIATRHINGILKEFLGEKSLKSVSVIAPGVLAQTGIETTEIVKACFKNVKPELIVAVDALAARDFKRLGSTIQLTNTGICPGSGVQNKRKELSFKVLGAPVLAIGIPTVVDLKGKSFLKKADQNQEQMMVTPKNIDLLIKRGAKLIANSLNKALFFKLKQKEIELFFS